MKKKKNKLTSETILFNEIAALIELSKMQVVAQVNSTMTLLFWRVGKRINEFVLNHKRAEYGKQKVITLSRHLTWSHFLTLFPLKSEAQRLFYAQQIIQEQLSVRDLRKQIEKKAYERTTIANAQLPDTKHHLSNNFKDPYLLDFLKLPSGYLENDLETAILKELERFILEVGKGFAFVERQKRMIIDGEDHYLDLLFFHRKLKRLIAIELKIGRFQAKHKGQMELYLKWLNKHERQPGEDPPVGLILCAETSREQVELLEMHKDGIMVAEYWTELPPRKELEKRLHNAYLEAKEMIDKRKLLE
jgi:predicted nuclease of restriction endonuclease-like (RecB) superfamily